MSANKGPNRPPRWKKPPTPPADAERWERLSPRELALGTHADVHGIRKEILEAIAKIGSTSNPAIERTLTALLTALQTITTRTTTMFEDLETKVAALTSASDAAEALLDGIKAKLDEIIAGGGLSQANKDKLAALSAGIGKEGEDLAAAVARNTPAEEPPA